MIDRRWYLALIYVSLTPLATPAAMNRMQCPDIFEDKHPPHYATYEGLRDRRDVAESLAQELGLKFEQVPVQSKARGKDVDALQVEVIKKFVFRIHGTPDELLAFETLYLQAIRDDPSLSILPEASNEP